MNFTLIDNQNGQWVVSAVDAAGQPATLPSDVAAVSSDSTTMTIAPTAGNAAGTYTVTAVKPGSVTITVTGTNSAGTVISTNFTFSITGGPAVGFTAVLTSVS